MPELVRTLEQSLVMVEEPKLKIYGRWGDLYAYSLVVVRGPYGADIPDEFKQENLHDVVRRVNALGKTQYSVTTLHCGDPYFKGNALFFHGKNDGVKFPEASLSPKIINTLLAIKERQS